MNRSFFALAATIMFFSLSANAESCCQKAKKAGKPCDHKCCVDAAKSKKSCEKCNPPKKDTK